jgi:hypothetical protein
MRRRARENPDTGVWLAVGAGVAVLGTAIYFLTRPSGTSTAPSAPNQVTAGAGTALTVKVGQVINPSLPDPPAGATGWSAVVENMSGQLSPTAGGFAAVAPGTATLRFTPVNRGLAVGLPDYTVAVVITA